MNSTKFSCACGKHGAVYVDQGAPYHCNCGRIYSITFDAFEGYRSLAIRVHDLEAKLEALAAILAPIPLEVKT